MMTMMGYSSCLMLKSTLDNHDNDGDYNDNDKDDEYNDDDDDSSPRPRDLIVHLANAQRCDYCQAKP